MLQIGIVLLFTMIIHSIDSLSYALRLGGLRARRITLALSLAGLMVLISRTSNIAQAPLMGSMVDQALVKPEIHLEWRLHGIIGAATLGTIAAMLLFPSIVRLCARMVVHLEKAGSVPRMMQQLASWKKLRNGMTYIKLPTWRMARTLFTGGVPKRLMALNVIVTAIYTVGVLSSLYAAYLWPAHQLTLSSSSGVINGVATILMTILIDPRLALLSDGVIRGKNRLSEMNQVYGLMMVSRLLGTMLAQLLLVPCAYWIGWLVL